VKELWYDWEERDFKLGERISDTMTAIFTVNTHIKKLWKLVPMRLRGVPVEIVSFRNNLLCSFFFILNSDVCRGMEGNGDRTIPKNYTYIILL
jgi:hypothetical protein